MHEPRFNLNSFILIALIFSAIGYFFTVGLGGIADWSAVNDFYQIEGCDYAIVYSDIKEDGIYEGRYEADAELRLEGSFGHDWGAFYDEPYLYVNRYDSTDMGFIRTSVVRIDTRDWSEERLLDDAIIRGTCRSGELVCLAGFALPATFPETNPLAGLYAIGGEGSAAGEGKLELILIDPSSSELAGTAIVHPGTDYVGGYLELTLDEILEEAAA